ncbi:MAG: rhodanese-related sulfurtransferase [Sulfurimonas sp.]|jgi:rhodanese-related sulfurtransferase
MKLITLVIAIALSLSAGNLDLKEEMTSAFKAQVADAKKSTKAISDKELVKWIDEDKKFVLVDIREANELTSGIIAAKNYKHIPRGVLVLKVFKKLALKPSETIVLYCKLGPRSAFAAKELQDFYGFKHVSYLEGGVKQWKKNGHKLEKYQAKQ